MKVSGENVRKATGEVDTSLKAADESFRGTKDRRFLKPGAFTIVVRVYYYLYSALLFFFFFISRYIHMYHTL